MNIAVPVTGNVISAHFGHCDIFAIFTVDPENRKVLCRRDVPSPEHKPGMLPPWLSKEGADVVIAGGMGQHARDLFERQGIKVVIGVQQVSPEKMVEEYLSGNLESTGNFCTH